MDPDAFNMMNVNLYGAVLMLIRNLTLMLGLASALYILVCLSCLACDNFVRNARSARRRMNPMTVRPEPYANDLLGALDGPAEGLSDSSTGVGVRRDCLW
jgi:hypothetical protein